MRKDGDHASARPHLASAFCETRRVRLSPHVCGGSLAESRVPPKPLRGHPVRNEQKQKVGIIDDLIIAPDTAVSFVIIGAGGFLGVGRHDVAIPANQLKQEDGKIVLPGATKEAIKALPKFEYAKK